MCVCSHYNYYARPVAHYSGRFRCPTFPLFVSTFLMLVDFSSFYSFSTTTTRAVKEPLDLTAVDTGGVVIPVCTDFNDRFSRAIGPVCASVWPSDNF